MKINLPVFKDEDAKDAVNLPELEVGSNSVSSSRGAGITPSLSYAIRSLQGYPGKLVQSSGMDITLDDLLTILDEPYNKVKALDTLNQELLQVWMAG